MKQASYSRDFASEAGSAEDRDTCIPRFYTDAEKFEVDGVSHWRDVELVEIIMPGNSLSKPVHPVTDIDRKRWPKSYAAFKEGQEMPVTGTPLEQWPMMTRSMVLKLKSLGFRTVEDVARMTEHAMPEVGMGARGLKIKAAAYVDDAAAQAITAKAIDEREHFQMRCGELEAANKELNEQLRQFGERLRYMEQNAQFQQQNISSTPSVTGAQPLPAQSSIMSPFAAFADVETRQSERREELAHFNAGGGSVAPEQQEASEVALDLPAKRRGRPTNAELAAKRAAEE